MANTTWTVVKSMTAPNLESNGGEYKLELFQTPELENHVQTVIGAKQRPRKANFFIGGGSMRMQKVKAPCLSGTDRHQWGGVLAYREP